MNTNDETIRSLQSQLGKALIDLEEAEHFKEQYHEQWMLAEVEVSKAREILTGLWHAAEDQGKSLQAFLGMSDEDYESWVRFGGAV